MQQLPSKLKVAVVGSRSFQNSSFLSSVLDQLREQVGDFTLVSGGARGADTLAATWALQRDLLITEHLPDWSKHGRRAGIIRNRDVVDDADLLLAFWDGDSPGTAHVIEYAREVHVSLVVYEVSNAGASEEGRDGKSP